MFSKVLVANRGEIAVRAFRAAYELGAQTVAVFPYEDRGSEHRLKADEAYEIGERGHPVRAYLDPEVIVAAARKAGADAVYPGYGFLSENPQLAEACANAGITFIGPTADVLTLTGNKARAIAAAKKAGVPTLASVEPSTDVDALVESAKDMPFPLFVKAVAGGGGRGMRRVDDARRTCARRSRPACARPRAPSATRRSSSSRRWWTPATSRCRSSPTADGNVHPPVRARLLGPAPAPEGRRDRPGAEPRPGDPRADVRRRGALRAGDRLPQRGHRGVPPRPRRQLRLHRDEPAHPGRAHRDRGGHRRRPGAGPDADRLRRDPGRPRPLPGHRRAARCRAAVPDHHRGPRQRVPPGHRQDHHLPLPRRRGRPPRRRYDVHRGGGVRALRLDAREADLPRSRLPGGGRPGPARDRRVPDPRRRDEHPVPPGRARRARLPGRPGDHRLHRGPPAAAHRPVERRPRHQAAQLPRRRDREPAARPGPRLGRPGVQAARPRPRRARPERHPAAAAPARPDGVRPPAARAEGRRGHGHDVPRRAPVAARDPGPHPRPARRWPATCPG